MRVLFCQTVPYLPDDWGGGLTNTDALCRALQRRDHDAAVLCGATAGGIRWPFSRARHDFPYPVMRSRDPLSAAETVCRGFKPDIAVVQFANAPGLVQRLTQLRVPVMVYQHDAFAAVDEQPGAACYLASSQTVASAMPRNLGARVDVMPVLIEPDAYRVARSGTMVTLINPIPRKGVEIAFALTARRPDLTFQLVEAWRLRNRVRDYLQSRVAHHGNMIYRTSTSDMRAVYGRTRLILAPSLGLEAWGRVVSEAQVSGIPALVSDSGGLPEAVGGGGLVVPRDAPIRDWSEALDRILDPAAYESFSAAALAHAARPAFQPDAIVDRFLALLAEHRR